MKSRPSSLWKGIKKFVIFSGSGHAEVWWNSVLLSTKEKKRKKKTPELKRLKLSPNIEILLVNLQKNILFFFTDSVCCQKCSGYMCFILSSLQTYGGIQRRIRTILWIISTREWWVNCFDFRDKFSHFKQNILPSSIFSYFLLNSWRYYFVKTGTSYLHSSFR